MITIGFDGVNAQIKGLPEEVIETLKYNFTVELEDEIYQEFVNKSTLPLTTSYGTKRHLIDIQEETVVIPTGLLVRVTRKLKELGLGFTVNKTLKDPEVIKKDLNPILREQQKLAVNTLLRYKRGYIESPTRSGKSWIIAEFFDQFAKDTWRLVIVPTKKLLYQMQSDIANYLTIPPEEVGLLGDGKQTIRPITIAIPNTLVQKVNRGNKTVIDYLNSVQVVIRDECHRYNNPTGAQVSSYTPNATYVEAVSATPWVSPLMIEAFSGPKLLEFSAEEMIEEKILMEPIIRFYESPSAFAPSRLLNMDYGNFKDPKVVWAWNQLVDYLIVNNPGRNKLAAELAKGFIDRKEGPILILVKKVGTSSKKENAVSHAKIIQEILEEEHGIKLPIIHGKTKIKDQEQVLEQMDSGEIPGVIASAGILSEGVTIPKLSFVILLCAGSSDVAFVQRVGRALGKKQERPIIVDFLDQHVFERQSEKRIACAEKIYPGCVEVISLSPPNSESKTA